MSFNEEAIYIGVTSNLIARIHQHKSKHFPGFTSSYNCDRLVHHEWYSSIEAAIQREKQLKRWKRKWKLDLVKSNNPDLQDLYPRLVNTEFGIAEDAESSSA